MNNTTDRTMPEAAELYTSAFHAELGRFCSVVKVDRTHHLYLVNFGHNNVWIPASELSRFTI